MNTEPPAAAAPTGAAAPNENLTGATPCACAGAGEPAAVGAPPGLLLNEKPVASGSLPSFESAVFAPPFAFDKRDERRLSGILAGRPACRYRGRRNRSAWTPIRNSQIRTAGSPGPV
jgi:hypothetical protein